MPVVFVATIYYILDDFSHFQTGPYTRSYRSPM